MKKIDLHKSKATQTLVQFGARGTHTRIAYISIEGLFLQNCTL